jgi:hypothetical protein
VTLQPLNPTIPSLPLISTLLPVIVEMPSEGGVPGGQSASSGNETTGQEGEGTATTSQGQSPVAVAASSAASAGATTSEPSEAQGGAVAAPSGTVPATLPNQASPKGGVPVVEGGGEPEDAEVPAAPAQPQTTPTAVAQFIVGLDASFARARLRALRGSLWGKMTQAENSESASQKLGGLLARWSPIVVGLGSPTLTLAVELALAALTEADPGDSVSPPADSEEACPESPRPSDLPPIEETSVAGPTPPNVVVAAIGLATVAWAHTHWYRPRSPRRRYRFPLPGREATRP